MPSRSSLGRFYRLLQTHAFEPELTDAMAPAYEETLRRLRLTDRTDP
jgi:hypothetical protein